MTTVKLGHRTHNRQHWSEVRTRGTSTGNPCSCRYTNGLLAESKIQTVYNRNTRRRNIKVYAGIATLALAHRPSAKAKECKKSATVTTGIEHAPSHARGVRVSGANQSLLELSVNIRIYTTNLRYCNMSDTVVHILE